MPAWFLGDWRIYGIRREKNLFKLNPETLVYNFLNF